MGKVASSAEYLLNQLGELSSYLTSHPLQGHDYFERPLQIIHQALGFHISVLYRITNVVENDLILEVVAVCNPEHIRPDLQVGVRHNLDLNNPPPRFANEVAAFCNRCVSAINVPGWGCDIVGCVYLPENLGNGYLLGGDFFGDESDIQPREVHVCEVMCNLLSSVLMKTQFEQLASFDALTGLLNSRTIREEVEKAFQRQKRRGDNLGAAALADIDFFKKINDKYGHIQGDSVLQEVGQILGTAIRQHVDVAGRYGGEEFLLIFGDTAPDMVFTLIERLRQKIADHAFKKIAANGRPVDGEFLHVTMSFGVAGLYDPLASSSQEIVARADAALYASKTGGRNRVTLATDAYHAR